MLRLFPGDEVLHPKWGLGIITSIIDKDEQKTLSVRFWRDSGYTVLNNIPKIVQSDEVKIVEELPPWKIFGALYKQEILVCGRCQEYQHGIISIECPRNRGLVMVPYGQRAATWCPLIKEAA